MLWDHHPKHTLLNVAPIPAQYREDGVFPVPAVPIINLAPYNIAKSRLNMTKTQQHSGAKKENTLKTEASWPNPPHWIFKDINKKVPKKVTHPIPPHPKKKNTKKKTGIVWIVPPPSNCGKWRFIGIPLLKT